MIFSAVWESKRQFCENRLKCANTLSGQNAECLNVKSDGRARAEPGGTRWRTGGELANGVGSQYSHATSERGLSSIAQADAHTSAASSRLNWRPHRFKWTRPFRGKMKSGFCACAITFRTSYTYNWRSDFVRLCVEGVPVTPGQRE